MGLVPVEKTFPRGTFKDHPVQSNLKGRKLHGNSRPKSSLFGNHYTVKSTKINASDTSNPDNSTNKKNKNAFYRLKQYAGQLSYKTVSEGMLVLGSIYKIEDLQLRVVLPGNVMGVVPITNISEPYTIAVRSAMLDGSKSVYQLRDMFHVGQHVVAKVVSKLMNGTRNVINLSLVPEVIYSDISHSDVVKGLVLVASVKSVEDKGYIMDLGIKNTRAFLNKKKSLAYEQTWNNGRPLGIGELVRCLVTQSIVAYKSATVVLTAAPDKVANASADSTGATLDTLIPGMKFTVTVSRILPTGIQVQLSHNFIGYIHQDHFSKSFKTPDNYEIGSLMTARVLYILQSGVVHFTMKRGILDPELKASPYEAIKLGAVIKDATVVRVTEAGLTVKVGKVQGESLKGFIPLSHLTHKPLTEDDKFDVALADQLGTEYPIGSNVTCRITNYNFMDQHYVCTMKKELMTEKIIHSDMIELGSVLQCFVKCVQLKGIVLTVGKNANITGYVPMVHASDVPLTHPEKKFQVGQLCMARVISLKDGNIGLSMKRSIIKSKSPILSQFTDANVGDTYEGIVLEVSGKGLLMQFYNFVTGWVPPEKIYKNKKITEHEILKKFNTGQLLRCTIVVKKEATRKLTLCLQDYEYTNEDMATGVESTSHASSWEDPHNESIGKKTHKKKKAQDKDTEELEPPKKQKMSLEGIGQTEATIKVKKAKEHQFKKEKSLLEVGSTQIVSPSINNLKENGVKSKKRSSLQESVPEEIIVNKKSKTKKKAVNGEKIVENVDKTKKAAVKLPQLALQSGFVWDATPDKLPVVSATKHVSDSSSDDESSLSKPVKRSHQAVIAEKRALAQQEEARLREIERRLMDSEQPPQSADEFDRLALSSPDSSMVWLQYMAFHLQATEIEKARNVAQRALKIMSFREEQERLNVWMALLNLENLFGSKESLDSTLEEAVRANDAYEVYTRMLQIYADSHKLQEGDKLVGIVTRKFKDHQDMWVTVATFYMKSGQMEKARALLQRALVGLQKKEHVAMICRFAHLENRLGCPVRAQTLMEQVLTSYPARVDVWSAYVDMLVKSGSVDTARQVLERAVVQRLSSHKMKTLFKKFLSFEEIHGDEKGANRVRQMALDYVESAGGVG